MSGKTFRALPEDLQKIVLEAGAKAGAFGRDLESSQDGEKLQQMLDAGQIKVSEFADRDNLLALVVPVQDAYAEELGAANLLNAIRSK